MIILLIVGIVLFLGSFLSVISKSFFEYSNNRLAGPVVDSDVLSKENRYFIRRYYAGFQGMLAGLACIVLYLFLNQQAFDAITNWFHTIL
jgi:hypothetical protein